MNETHLTTQAGERISVPKAPFACPEQELLDRLGVDPSHGLSHQEAARRLHAFGNNEPAEYRGRTILQILIDQFRSLIVWLLTIAAALSFYLGDIPEALAIVAVLVINAGIGFVTELRAIRSMESLQRMTRVTTRVRRENATRKIDAAELVPGDIVTLEAGDIIPADLRLLEAANFRFNESMLTGESTPVTKELAVLKPDTEFAERSNMAFKGTAVSQGAGKGVVVATGTATELGRISRLVHEAESELSPLEKRLDKLGQKLIWLMLVPRGHDGYRGRPARPGSNDHDQDCDRAGSRRGAGRIASYRHAQPGAWHVADGAAQCGYLPALRG
jgi:Ca2+-transporting ATPase